MQVATSASAAAGTSGSSLHVSIVDAKQWEYCPANDFCVLLKKTSHRIEITAG